MSVTIRFVTSAFL